MASQKTKLERISLLEQKAKLQENLPHIYGHKMYKWMRDFFESRNKINLLVSGNQSGKSSIQIRKMIHWATSPDLWPELWDTPPRMFWYLYPSAPLATQEYHTKWLAEWLPRGPLRDDPVYGWKPQFKGYLIQSIHFNIGPVVYFKTYSQDPADLQAGTVAAIFCDEEPPLSGGIVDELFFRLAATRGYFHAAFTATLGQEFWREAMEVRGQNERFPDAFKRSISLYDCLEYEDGSQSFWTNNRIKQLEATCKSQAEIDKRIHGKFILSTGRKFPGFDRDRNICAEFNIPSDYRIFGGVDFGSGGNNGHPSAVCFVAVNPKTMDEAYVFRGARFDNQITTASDLVQLVVEMKSTFADRVEAIFYDWSCADLREIAFRMGEVWIPAEKSHAIGEQRVNVLFKSGMLKIFDTEELHPLQYELMSAKSITRKTEGGDDMCDALRYSIAKVPFDWSKINGQLPPEPPKIQTQVERRMEFFKGGYKEEKYDIEEDFQFWNELY